LRQITGEGNRIAIEILSSHKYILRRHRQYVHEIKYEHEN